MDEHHIISDSTHRVIDTILKVVTPVGVCMLLLLQTQFVSRAEFSDQAKNLATRVDKMEAILIRMELGIETDARHQKALDDHETRIRTLEKRP